MVLSSTPVAAIAAETAQNTSGEAAAAATGVKFVSFFANGGTFGDGTLISMNNKTNENGEINPPKAPVRDGYVFDGWYYDSTFTQAVDFSQPLQGGTDHFMLYAKWTEAPSNVLEVTYSANGGQFADGNNVMLGQTDSNGIARQPLAPTRDGYVFAGWYYHSDGTDQVDFNQPIVGGSKHVTLFAAWTPAKQDKTIEILYVANGGTFFDGNETMQGVTDTDGFARLPLQPTREGYTFAGWTYDREGTDPVDFSKPLVGGGDHATLYAQWNAVEKDNSIDVLYVANGGTFFDGSDALQGVTDGDGVARQPLAPTREGYTFAGWTYDSEGKDSVDFSKPVQGGGDHVTFYAQWTKNETPAVQTHKVNFYVAGSTTTVEVEDGKTVAQPSDPSVDGFNFVGWSSSKESFKKFDFSTPITEDTTVYAFFTAKTPKSDSLKKNDGKKQVPADKKDEAKAKKNDAALPTTGDPTFVVTSAAALTGAVAVAVGMYMTKRREH